MPTKRTFTYLVLMLVCGVLAFSAFAYYQNEWNHGDDFSPTMTAITSHNNAIGTLIEGTLEKETATFLPAPSQ